MPSNKMPSPGVATLNNGEASQYSASQTLVMAGICIFTVIGLLAMERRRRRNPASKSGIPNFYDKQSFLASLCRSLHLEEGGVTLHSFSTYPNKHQTITATVTFNGHNFGHQRDAEEIEIIHLDSKQVNKIRIDTHFKGFTPISPVENEKVHLVDLVAIHGWGSHPLGGFKASGHDANYVWLRDSLGEDIPEYRVFLYGYACDLTDENLHEGVDEFATTFWQLLNSLQRQRQSEPPIPLVFVVHSLGGIVLKQAIVSMKENSRSDVRRTLESIYGALFFGVPSEGMETRALRSMIGETPQQHILNSLDQSRGFFPRKKQHDEFCRAFDYRDSKIIRVFETRKSPTVIQNSKTGKWTREGPMMLLVPPTSATCGRVWEDTNETILHITADHSNMVKFSSEYDDGYVKVKDVLQTFIKDAPDVIKQRLQQQEPVLACLKSIAFPEMDIRRQTTRSAYGDTCKWIISHSSYNSWLLEDQGSGILWIKGKPGSGKSTLMAFLLDHFKSQPTYQGSTQVYFFFHARGSTLQRSRLGMYRSLLYQLLESKPVIESGLYQTFINRVETRGEPGKKWEWQADELCLFFLETVSLISRTQRISIFIDALDEAGDKSSDYRTRSQILKDFHILNDLLKRDNLNATIIISSRHRPVVAHNPAYEIYVEDENQTDIRNYVHDAVAKIIPRHSSNAEDLARIADAIIRGARGIFQWASLALDVASLHEAGGESPESIIKLIQELPEELAEIYEYILKNVVQERYREQTMRLFRLLHFATRPFSIRELFCAIHCDDTDSNPSGPSAQDPIEASMEALSRMKSLVITWSGGLVETATSTDSGMQVCQYIHQSVSDFIAQGGLGLINQIPFGEDVIGQGHLSLSLVCANYLSVIESKHWEEVADFNESLKIKEAWAVSAERELFIFKFPFLHYAARSWFWHAQKAEMNGVPPTYLVEYLGRAPRLLELWIAARSALFSGEDYRRDCMPHVSVNLLLIASSMNLTSVVEHLFSKNSSAGQRKSHEARALYLATRHGKKAIVEILLRHGIDISTSNGERGETLLQAAGSRGAQDVVHLLLDRGADINARGFFQDTPLQTAAYLGHQAIVALYLDRGADPNAQGGLYGNPLQAAAYRGYQIIVQLLLKGGAHASALGGEYGTALIAAAHRGHREIVHLLLNAGAEASIQQAKYGSALIAAMREGHREIVQLLLDAGAHINISKEQLGSTLIAAIRRGHREIMQLLLDTRADMYIPEKELSSAIQSAAYSGHHEILQMLIKRGVAMEDQWSINELRHAAWHGHQQIVELLLERGIDANGPGGVFGTALQAAAYAGQFTIAQTLLKRGADVNATAGYPGTALQAAARNGFTSMVQLLLQYGPDVNAVQGDFSNPLQSAAYAGHYEIVELLLNAGADMEAPAGEFGTALSAARSSHDGHNVVRAENKLRIAQLLLGRGAKDEACKAGLYYSVKLGDADVDDGWSVKTDNGKGDYM